MGPIGTNRDPRDHLLGPIGTSSSDHRDPLFRPRNQSGPPLWNNRDLLFEPRTVFEPIWTKLRTADRIWLARPGRLPTTGPFMAMLQLFRNLIPKTAGGFLPLSLRSLPGSPQMSSIWSSNLTPLPEHFATGLLHFEQISAHALTKL